MRRRLAFTLPELLVSLALIMFIMAIIATAFQAGLQSFRALKALGEMQEGLRTANSIIRSDLQDDHFGDPVNGIGGPRLRDQRLNDVNWEPPLEGFFRIYQGARVAEAPDADGILNARASNEVLHFTVRKRGNRPEDYFSASVPVGSPLERLGPTDFGTPGVFRSHWAEVMYFLRPYTPARQNGQVQLYRLYRRQRLLAEAPNVAVPITNNAQDYREISTRPGTGVLLVNTPRLIGLPHQRFAAAAAPNMEGRYQGGWNLPGLTLEEQFGAANNPQAGDDLLLSDVVSFEVKATGVGIVNNQPWPPLATVNPDYPFADIPFATNNQALQTQRVFDTWTKMGVSPPDNLYPYDVTWNLGQPTPMSVPNRIRVTGIKITIRIWNQKTEQTRQITIIQDM